VGVAKPIYPRKAQIERAIAAARAGGIKVGGIEIDPDGTIRILEGQSPAATDAYERWATRKKNA
jgi:hypothetical protein